MFFSDLFDLPGLTRQESKESLSSDHSGKDDTDEQWLSQVMNCHNCQLCYSNIRWWFESQIKEIKIYNLIVVISLR